MGIQVGKRLTEMEQGIPWSRLTALIELVHPEGKVGREISLFDRAHRRARINCLAPLRAPVHRRHHDRDSKMQPEAVAYP